MSLSWYGQGVWTLILSVEESWGRGLRKGGMYIFQIILSSILRVGGLEVGRSEAGRLAKRGQAMIVAVVK